MENMSEVSKGDQFLVSRLASKELAGPIGGGGSNPVPKKK